MLRTLNVCILLAVLAFTACRPARPVPAGPVGFSDGLGRRVVLPAPPERIISFAPSLTEMTYALGGQDRLVGVTAWCNHPPQAGNKPKVGDYSAPGWERIVSLKPDLVILVGTERSPMIDRLKALGIPSAAFRSESVEDVMGEISLLGKILGRTPQADSMAALLRARLDSLRPMVDTIAPGKRPRVFAEISDRPLMTGSDQSFLGQLIALAGGVNIFANLNESYAAVNPELVAGGKPDVILILHPGTSPAEVEKRIGWASIPAVKNGRIVANFDLDLVMRPGPRLAEAALMLHHALYPDEK